MAELSTGDSATDSLFHHSNSSNIKPETSSAGRRHISTDTHAHRPVSSCFALVHDFSGNDLVQPEHVFVSELFFGGLLLDMPERGEVIDYFLACPRVDRHELFAFLDRTHLLQRERV